MLKLEMTFHLDGNIKSTRDVPTFEANKLVELLKIK
jgi:hypothetical protein